MKIHQTERVSERANVKRLQLLRTTTVDETTRNIKLSFLTQQHFFFPKIHALTVCASFHRSNKRAQRIEKKKKLKI